MKKIIQSNFLYQFILVLVFVFVSSNGIAQVAGREEAKEFRILFESTDKEIKLTCREGCSFEFLSFNLRPNQVQTIDLNGMVSMNPTVEVKDDHQSGFKFKLRRTEHGFELEGISGTNWKVLNFNCRNFSCTQSIDQNGMFSE